MMNKEILRIAIPSIVSNITVPLLGLVDIAITGHLGDAAYIGAIAIGSTIFNLIYWLFGFLRMGTGGLTAQAYGADNKEECTLLLFRSLRIGLAISSAFILLQAPFFFLAKMVMSVPQDVLPHVATYFNILIWGVPAMLSLYGFTGWFLGMQNARFPMWIAIIQNVVNISLSLLLVTLFDMKVEGIAIGTLVAQYSGLFLALFLWRKSYVCQRMRNLRKRIFSTKEMSRFFKVNRTIFLRTLCLISVSVAFTSFGAQEGSDILAANALLMQFFLFFSYVSDGFAYAGEAIGGRLFGADDRKNFTILVRQLMKWGFSLSILFTGAYLFLGPTITEILTDEPVVTALATEFLPFAIGIPLVSFSAFVFDGIFIGTTSLRAMLWTMLAAAIAFFITFYALRPASPNHALWTAFTVYLLVRSLLSIAFYKFNCIFAE